MPLPRAGCAVAGLGNGVMVAGGTYWQEGQKIWCDRTDRLDAATGEWTALPPLPRLAGDAAGVSLGGKFIVIGGGGAGPGAASVLGCDERGRWEQYPDLPAGRRSVQAVVHEGQVFVLGGLAGPSGDFRSATRDVWSWQPGGKWSERSPLPGPARFNAAVGSVQGVLLVAGGCTPEGEGVKNLDDILAYDAATDRWSVIGRLPVALRGAFAISAARELMVLGGYTDGFTKNVLRVSASDGSVASIGELPVALADARFVATPHGIIGVTGENGIKMRFPDVIRTRPFAAS